MDPLVVPGFSDPPIQSALAFRAILDAMARPGKIVAIEPGLWGPAPMNPASAVIALTMLDHETPVWLDAALDVPAVRDYLRFHCSTPISDAGSARFAFFSACPDPAHLAGFPVGTAEYPDRSATLVIQVERLANEAGVRLSGPGIRDERQLSAGGVGDAFWSWAGRNNERFPLGVDVLLASPSAIAALPRSVRISGVG